MSIINIRRMRPADKSAVMAILHATPEFLAHEVIVAEELIDAFLENPRKSGYRILVAEIGGLVVGYVCYGETPLTEGTWDIYWIAVDPKRKGMGVGGRLMKKAEAIIKKSRGRLAIIETSSKQGYNKTRRFHISQGYHEIARIPDFYSVGDAKVIMVKQLR